MIYNILTINKEVTELYLSVLKIGINNCIDADICEISRNQIKNIDFKKNDWIISSTIIDTLICYMHNGKNIITWFQGIAPEESYLRNNSKLRMYILSVMEKKALSISRICVLVSNAMLTHFEHKYNLDLKDKVYIMPCFNELLNRNAFWHPRKYENNVFAYVGSLSKYQCFDRILGTYYEIESIYQHKVSLLVMTKQVELAKNIIKQTHIKYYDVKYVPKEEVSKELYPVKFGFIVRDNNIVNRVATPTKISSYLANGVIPIYSSNLEDFAKFGASMYYSLCINDDAYINKLKSLMNTNINPQSVLTEYESLFYEYYERDNYIKQFTEMTLNMI